MEKLQIELNGKKFYWDDVHRFLEWFSYKMGKHTKIVMDMLMEGNLVVADIVGVTDELISNVYVDMVEMKDQILSLKSMNKEYADTIHKQAKIIREMKNRHDIDVMEDRLMEAERMLAKIGMSLNYKERLK